MNAAWEQIGDVLAANRASAPRSSPGEAAQIWYDRHLRPMLHADPGRALTLTAPGAAPRAGRRHDRPPPAQREPPGARRDVRAAATDHPARSAHRARAALRRRRAARRTSSRASTTARSAPRRRRPRRRAPRPWSRSPTSSHADGVPPAVLDALRERPWLAVPALRARRDRRPPRAAPAEPHDRHRRGGGRGRGRRGAAPPARALGLRGARGARPATRRSSRPPRSTRSRTAPTSCSASRAPAFTPRSTGRDSARGRAAEGPRSRLGRHGAGERRDAAKAPEPMPLALQAIDAQVVVGRLDPDVTIPRRALHGIAPPAPHHGRARRALRGGHGLSRDRPADVRAAEEHLRPSCSCRT